MPKKYEMTGTVVYLKYASVGSQNARKWSTNKIKYLCKNSENAFQTILRINAKILQVMQQVVKRPKN